MKVHTTNYTNTFIAVADDCTATTGLVPPVKENNLTAANIQFEMISKQPYHYNSDDVLFQVFADKNDLSESEYKAAREQFFSKGQPCFRASPLTKRYGWGVHNDSNGKIALYAVGSAEYEKLANDQQLQIVKAMKSKR